VPKKVIGLFFREPLGLGPGNQNSAIGKTALLSDGVGVRIPSGSLQLRHDELTAGVGFGWVAGDSLNGWWHPD
jgi:hypothetical protein